jgi:hypothetical protein
MNSDFVQSVASNQQAIAHWIALNERSGLAATLPILALSGVHYYTDLSIAAPLSAAACIAWHEQAQQIAHENWLARA